MKQILEKVRTMDGRAYKSPLHIARRKATMLEKSLDRVTKVYKAEIAQRAQELYETKQLIKELEKETD